ncbi:MAG: 50S ribosomal protein L24 [Candidatus Omnitrophica bacterium]|jgi:large subunit ribosomal protein L24|nr:50S ribosomal protein L24 [Candidatus Omnitrophota bacterium]
MKAGIRKNDFVMVIKGKDRGKKGRVLHVLPRENRILIEGVNFVKKHTKPRSATQQGGIITMEKPISISNVQYFCMRCNKPVRLGIKKLDDKTDVRVCKKCGEIAEIK